MGAKSQRKGRAAELELARLLQGCGYDVEPGRALNFGEKPDLCGLPWCIGDGLPAVFFRRSREPWAVVMRLGDWLELYRNYPILSGLERGEIIDTKAGKGHCGLADPKHKAGSGAGGGH